MSSQRRRSGDVDLHAISCFSGIGGLDLALEPFGVRTIAYCESDAYCQRVLVERIREGHLNDAPIWDEVSTFPTGDWRGRVDLVHGGFPCQDLSVAGRGAGLAGARSGLFFEILRVACGVGSRPPQRASRTGASTRRSAGWPISPRGCSCF
jgi:DNA (cytosine-5)-methyltransferase 1